MANRRMISKTVLCADTFTELPARTRLLYVYLIMEADDDGLIGTTKNALFLSGANAKDLRTLVDKGYIIKFDSGVCAIRHWLLMNKVQGTRKTATAYVDELLHLETLSDKTYRFCQQNVDNLSEQSKSISNQYSQGQVSVVQDRLSEDTEHIGSETANEWTNFMQNPDFKKIHAYFTEKIGNIKQPEHYKILNDLLSEHGLNNLMICIDFMAKNSAGKSVPYLVTIFQSHPELLD